MVLRLHGSRGLLVPVSYAAAGVLMTASAGRAGWIYNEAEAPVRAAIVEAVRARIGSDVDVTIGALLNESSGGSLGAHKLFSIDSKLP
jgi:hypothetical protein